jgi:excisionase family DNA binding protein
MRNEIFIDGVPFISARHAAREAGLSRDYLSKLARAGKITGHRLGNIWFLDRQAVKSFVDDKERSRAERRAQLSRMRVDEYRASAHKST